jgi:hypothetical protein
MENGMQDAFFSLLVIAQGDQRIASFRGSRD